MSYRVALEAKLEMCPPKSESFRLVRTTMARAFQRTIERMRRSMNRSPGMRASWVTGMVLRYGVVIAYGSWEPLRVASSPIRVIR